MPPYPEIEPYQTGLLDTGDGNLIYWEACGNRDGVPALMVHGGPGSGCTIGSRRSFDPEKFNIVIFDQRNCGRSLPHASDPAADMSLNTTEHLLRDMEQLREHLGVDKWLLRGGSWGVTLSLAYAERYPERVSGMLMLSVTSTRRLELDWLYRGAGRFFPEAWARFRDFPGLGGSYRLPTDSEPPIEGLLMAYSRLMEDPSAQVRSRAAAQWLAWEDAVISQESSGSPGSYSARPDDARLAFVRICAHYFANGAFLEDGVLIREAGKLAGIPGVLIHGRNDISGGVHTAWELARAWPGAELIIVEDSGHTGSTTMTDQMHAAADRLYEQITGSLLPHSQRDGGCVCRPYFGCMDRRIFGIETEYGITCTFGGERRLTPDEVARYLFRHVTSWGRSSNVFLRNGARLYLDVGSHPEYATPECDNVTDLVTHDKAGERVLEDLLVSADRQLREEGIAGDIYLFKNNTDFAGNSYGCHENYLVPRNQELGRLTDSLTPFLVTRQLICGAGKVLPTPRGTMYCLSQRADHIWEAVSSATTRSRPIINTRDEPHADADLYRRLHVIVGDSNMSETTMLLKIGATDLVLRMIEAGAPLRDMTLDNPIRAIRAVSHDITGRNRLRQANGRAMSALEIQSEYLTRARDFTSGHGISPDGERVLELWERALDAIETGSLDKIAREIDWVTKYQLIERYRTARDLPLSAPRIAQLDLAYHDVCRDRGLYYLLQRRGAVERVIEDPDIFAAKSIPPQTTRARLRGEFIRRAQEKGRDYTVDWVHLKLNDQAQRAVLCKDPFRSVDERVERLMAGL